jgi:glycosyltransferase involved in cell wall biosynthesis
MSSKNLTIQKQKNKPTVTFEPNLSVIVTAPNSKSRIVETIASILNQPDPLGTEVILVAAKIDSGEVEHLQKEFHAQMTQERLRIFGLPEDALWVNLKNYGAKKARGKRITFVHSGDLYLPNRLKALEEQIKGTLFLGSPELPILKPEDLFQALLDGVFKWMDSSVVIDRTLFWQLGGYPVGPFHSAESLWLKALAHLKKSDSENRIGFMVDPHIEEHTPPKRALTLPSSIQATAHRVQQIQARISALRYAPLNSWLKVVKSIRKVK